MKLTKLLLPVALTLFLASCQGKEARKSGSQGQNVLFSLVEGETGVTQNASADSMPVADMHCHPVPWVPAEEFLVWMDENGVQWCGLGVWGGKYGARSTREEYARVLGNRYVAFGGQSDLNAIYLNDGKRAQEYAGHRKFKEILQWLENDLKNARIKGIGEIFANTRSSNKHPRMRRKTRLDSPAMRALFALTSQYGAVLTFHTHWDDDSIAQVEVLLESNPHGKIVFAHCGVDSSPPDVQAFFEKHPGAYCDLSARHVPKLPKKFLGTKRQIFSSDAIVPEWKDLIEEFPDRFMVGTDLQDKNQYAKSVRIIRKGLLANLSPTTAEKVAYKNAMRLFGLQYLPSK